jgi:hypothetical protein
VRHRYLQVFVLAACAAASSSVAAFAEDLCWRGDGTVTACTPLPDTCLPAGTIANGCLTDALTIYTAAAATYPHLRSSVHVDATYLMAQRVGFSADDAYWIAVYNEAVDLGEYEPVDYNGLPFGGGTLATAVIDGFERINLAGGGVYYHFVSPRGATVADVDGLHPDLQDAETEGFLVHLRAWAMAQEGLGRPLCTDGLSAWTGFDYALGSSCYLLPGATGANIDSNISALATVTISFTAVTGSQLVVTSNTPGGPVYAEDFDTVIGGSAQRVADARLGIYLHALGDRISHHVCTDRTALVGPIGLPRAFSVDMSNSDCGQALHALRHMWEVGVAQSGLAAEDQTLSASLALIYDELAAFAGARGTLTPDADLPASRDEFIAELMSALAREDGGQRLEALMRIGCARGFEPFPGLGACMHANGFE